MNAITIYKIKSNGPPIAIGAKVRGLGGDSELLRLLRFEYLYNDSRHFTLVTLVTK